MAVDTETNVARKRPNAASIKLPHKTQKGSATQRPTTQPCLARRRGRSGRSHGDEHGEDAEGQRDAAPDEAAVLGGEDEAAARVVVADTGECARTRGGTWPSTFSSTRDVATDALE